MTEIIGLKEKISGILYPRVCPVCGRILTVGQMQQSLLSGNNPFICWDCYKKLDFFEGRARCLKCGGLLENEDEEFCNGCKKRKRFFDKGLPLMVHNEPARKMIYDLKYMNMKDNADFIGFEMAKRMKIIVEEFRPQVIIPVPLHRKRFLKRGYNQAEVISKKMVHYMKLLYGENVYMPKITNNILIRSKETVALKNFKADERGKAINGAFVAGMEPVPARILILDDIYTTGATINECARTLKTAGAQKIFFITASA